MKNTKFLIAVIFLTFLIMYQSVTADGRQGYEEVPYIYDANADCGKDICIGLTQVNKTQNGGLMDFLITVKLKVNVSKLDIALRVSDEITYNGETKWIDTVSGNMTRYYPIQIDVPENDTSAIELQATGKCYGDGVSPLDWGLNRIYFVTTVDTLGLYHYFPKKEKDEPEKQKRSGRVIPGEFPDRDSLYGIPESTDNDVPVINPNDMTGFEKWEPKTRLEYQYEHIRELEKTPLEDDGQLIGTDDGKYWLRNKGEYKFRQVEPTRDETTKRVIDSIEALPGDYDLVFVLNYQPYFEFVDSLVDDLQPLEEEGFYRATISKELWRKIDERGVSIFRWEMYKNILNSKSEKKDKPEKKEPDSQGSLENDLSGLSES